MRSLSIGATGMLAQQIMVDVISNNIANLTTTSFKKQRVEFQDLLYQDLRFPGAASADDGSVLPSGLQVGVGVRPAAVYRISQQGELEFTDNALDLALNGKGYFSVVLPNGESGYTRAGAFQLDPQGQIVTADGYVLEPSITIPQDSTGIIVNANGEVSVRSDGQVDNQRVGQFQLTTFANESGLEALGKNIFRETVASGSPVLGIPGVEGVGSIEQGALERSNINIIQEITNLITAQRAYEMNSRVIQASDEMLSSVSQLR